MVPYFKQSINNTNNRNKLNLFQNDNPKLKNINYQTLFHELAIKDWLWICVNFLFYEVKHYVVKNLCEAIIKKDELTLSQDNMVDLYIEYVRIIYTLEFRDNKELINNTIIDSIFELKDILHGNN